MKKLYEVQVVFDQDMDETLYCVVAHYQIREGEPNFHIVACYTKKEDATDSVKDEIMNDLSEK